MTSKALHPHYAKDALTHIEACFPFGAKINVDEIFFTTGGGATNNAATFARLGKFRAAAFCRIGDDSAGRDVLEALRKDRVDTSLVQKTIGHTHEEHTAFSVILSPGGSVGERTILVYRGASSRFDHAAIPWNKLHARWFHLSSLGGDLALLKKILDHAKRIGAHVSMNPGGQELAQTKRAKPLFQKLDFLILNREEAAKLTGVKAENTKGLLRALTKFSPRVVMTDGSKGAYAVTRQSRPTTYYVLPPNERVQSGACSGIAERGRETTSEAKLRTTYSAYYVPSVGHKPKNITGAGDAFGSGFITGWIKSNGDIVEALRVGSFNADSVVQKIGAKVGILRQYPSGRMLTSLPVKKIKL